MPKILQMYECIYSVHVDGVQIRVESKLHMRPEHFDEELAKWNRADQGYFEYRKVECREVKIGKV